MPHSIVKEFVDCFSLKSRLVVGVVAERVAWLFGGVAGGRMILYKLFL